MILRRALAGTAAALVLTACGTTVPLAQQAGTAQQGDGLTGSTTTGGGSLDGSASTGPGSTSTGGSTTGNVVDPVGSGTGGGAGSTTGTGAAVPPTISGQGGNGRGVTDNTITIGVAVAGGTSQLANAFGISGAPTVDEVDVLNVVVNDINRHGGILGRKLQIYTHSFDAATYLSNPAQVLAEICSDFRDDHKVFAVVFNLADPALRACTAKMGSPLLVLDGVSSMLSQKAYDENGGSFLYGVNNITTERLSKLLIESLAQRSFFEMWDVATGAKGGVGTSKLGLIHVDTPDQNALYADYAAELSKRGLRFTDTVTYKQDASTALAATQSAVLKFRADGITHVFGASAFFLQDAQSQNYHPRYAYLPGLGALGAENSPASQLKGAMTVGWSPTVDVEATEDPGPSPAAKRCLAIMKPAGFTPQNRQDSALEYSVCDLMNLVKGSLTASGSPTVAGFRRGVESLGTRLGVAYSFSATLGLGHHYGADVVRDMVFDSGCSCLRYSSRTNRS
ncbi:MAG: hypothetical protein JWO22_2229 [Frankiales bacterium]|nr:hypothetical protein [Frankiales bacterium]